MYCRFERLKDAKEFVEKKAEENPDIGIPKIMTFYPPFFVFVPSNLRRSLK